MALFFGILTVTLTLQVRVTPCACHALRGVSVGLASHLAALGPLRGKLALSADTSGAVASPRAFSALKLLGSRAQGWVLGLGDETPDFWSCLCCS